MAVKIGVDHRKVSVVIARFLNEANQIPKPPNPAWCLFVDGKLDATFTLGQERDLIEAYFRKGAGE